MNPKYADIPEPGSLMGLGLAAGAIIWAKRRKEQSKAEA